METPDGSDGGAPTTGEHGPAFPNPPGGVTGFLGLALLKAGSGFYELSAMKPTKNAGADENTVCVFLSSRESKCPKCAGQIGIGDRITLEEIHAICEQCAGIASLVFLPSGDTALTRRATLHTGKKYPVFKFSRARKRNERQGVLVAQEALDQAKKECEADASEREGKQVIAAKRREKQDAQYRAAFAGRIRELYPAAPAGVEGPIADHACRKYSGRVGRSAAAKKLFAETVDLAVRAHIRHAHTKYDSLFARGFAKEDARREVRGKVDEVAARWRGEDQEM